MFTLNISKNIKKYIKSKKEKIIYTYIYII